MSDPKRLTEHYTIDQLREEILELFSQGERWGVLKPQDNAQLEEAFNKLVEREEAAFQLLEEYKDNKASMKEERPLDLKIPAGQSWN